MVGLLLLPILMIAAVQPMDLPQVIFRDLYSYTTEQNRECE